MKKSITKEPDSVRTKKIEIELPVKFYEFMEKICELKGVPVNEFIVEDLLGALESELDECLGNQLGLPVERFKYHEYVESLAYPEAVSQEVQV